MNRLEALFDRALRDGCGTSLDAIVRSSRYRQAVRRYRRVPAIYRARGEGSIADLGLWEFAAALNTLGETTARSVRPDEAQPAADPHYLALLDQLGRQLIRSARGSLTPDGAELASDWTTMSGDEQLAAAFAYAKQLRKAHQNTSDTGPVLIIEGNEIDDWLADYDLMSDPAYRFIETGNGAGRRLEIYDNHEQFTSRTKIRIDVSESLPRAFLAPDAKFSPNCLGLAILLAGFADRTGSPYYVCSYLEHRKSAPGYHDAVRELKYIQLLEEFDLPVDEVARRKSLAMAQRAINDEVASALEDFHYAIIIQLADKSWAIIDPYQQTVARLAPEYEMDQAAVTLDRYRDLYPGLTVLASDEGRLAETLATETKLLDAACRHVGSLLQRYREELLTPQWIAMLADMNSGFQTDIQLRWHSLNSYYRDQYLTESDAGLWYESVIRQHQKFKKFAYDREFACEITSGVSNVVQTIVEIEDSGRLTPEQFDNFQELIFESVVESLDEEDQAAVADRVFHSYYDCVVFATEELIPVIWSGRIYSHPVIEIINPEYGLALALINQLRCWSDQPIDGHVLLNFGSSQQYWHDAVDKLASGQITQPTRIEALVRELPFHYPVVQNKLDYLDQRRSNEA
jgi:hypothetical protein